MIALRTLIPLFLALAATTASAQETLKDEELVKFITAKPLNVIRERDGSSIRLDFRADGTFYQNVTGANTKTGARGVSGKWKLDDSKGRYCLDLNDGFDKESCYSILTQGDKTQIVYGSRNSPKVWATIKTD